MVGRMSTPYSVWPSYGTVYECVKRVRAYSRKYEIDFRTYRFVVKELEEVSTETKIERPKDYYVLKSFVGA